MIGQEDLRALLTGSPADFARRLRELPADGRRQTVRFLMAVLEDASEAVSSRRAAGRVLSYVGDPRVLPLAPAMMRVAPGPFLMGTRSEDVLPLLQRHQQLGLRREWLLKETPRHEVSLPEFEIGRCPVTNLEYKRFVDDAQYQQPRYWQGTSFPDGKANHPVWGVSWGDAVAYCQWLGAQTGVQYRLPTEAEWEKAARGTDGREYPWGDAFDPGRCNSALSGIGDTTPVGIFPDGASLCGALDMAGNVEEWTSDWFYPYLGFDQGDLDFSHETWVCRGGAFDGVDTLRCARRHGQYASDQHIGFRLARSVT